MNLFMAMREEVRTLTPEERGMLVKAVCIEEGDRNEGEPAMYAWNRVGRAVDEAQAIEKGAA